MPRKPDPSRLTEKEAKAFRDFVKRMKRLKSVTSEQIADRVGWDVRRVTNALSESQPLLAHTAVAIGQSLHEVGRLNPAADRLFLEFSSAPRDPSESPRREWLKRYEKLNAPPSVVIPESEIERFAQFIALQSGAGKRTQETIRYAIASVLKRSIKGMPNYKRLTSAWLEEAGTAIDLYVRFVAIGKRKWRTEDQRDVLRLDPVLFAREVICKAASLLDRKGTDK